MANCVNKTNNARVCSTNVGWMSHTKILFVGTANVDAQRTFTMHLEEPLVSTARKVQKQRKFVLKLVSMHCSLIV